MRALLFILTVFVIFSGCIEEKNLTQSNESVHHGSVNRTTENLSSTTLSSKAENIPEIEITSFSNIYMHTNFEDEYFFSWDSVPGNENQRLISYLLEKNKLTPYPITSWGNHAEIIKSDDNKTIRVYFSNSKELMLEDNKSNFLRTPDVELEVREVNGKYKVLLTSQTLRSVELEGKEVNGKLCIYKINTKTGYNLTESYYAVYDLSIKNNGSKDLDFKLKKLHVRDGDHIFNATIEPEYLHSYSSDVLSDIEKEAELEDTTLSPGQTINGVVVFQVNSLYNKSLLLMYNETPITSTSFEKSIEALRTAEQYNYSIAFGKPPYTDSFNDSFEYSDTFSNWVNRSIFEVFKEANIGSFKKNSSLYTVALSANYIPETELVYALEVIPATNITLLPVRSSSYEANRLLVVDDTGEELINTSIDKIVILKNQTYELQSTENTDFPQIIDNSQMKMNFSNVTIVRISFWRDYWHNLLSRINQSVIVDEELKIVAASNKCGNFFS